MFCNIKGTKICILSGESQKGINTFQQCWVENQKGAITLDYFCTAIAPFWLSTEQLYSVNAILTLKWQFHLGLLCFRHQYNLIKLIPNLNSRVLVLKFLVLLPMWIKILCRNSSYGQVPRPVDSRGGIKGFIEAPTRGWQHKILVKGLRRFSHGEQNL